MVWKDKFKGIILMFIIVGFFGNDKALNQCASTEIDPQDAIE